MNKQWRRSGVINIIKLIHASLRSQDFFVLSTLGCTTIACSPLHATHTEFKLGYNKITTKAVYTVPWTLYPHIHLFIYTHKIILCIFYFICLGEWTTEMGMTIWLTSRDENIILQLWLSCSTKHQWHKHNAASPHTAGVLRSRTGFHPSSATSWSGMFWSIFWCLASPISFSCNWTLTMSSL